MKSIKLVTALFFVAASATLLMAASKSPPAKPLTDAEKRAKWASIKKADNSVRVSDAWEEPVNLGGPVNTVGWEDSASISTDGKTLTFAYFRLDPIALIFKKKLRVDGPLRPGWPESEPWNTYGAEIYVAEKEGGEWRKPENTGAPVNLPQTADGDQWLSDDGRRIYFNSAEGERKKGIYFAEREGPDAPWREPVYLGRNINSGHDDENPFLSSDERFLYFESARGGGYGGKDLYVSEKAGGVWGEPVNLGPTVNSKHDDVQPFISSDGRTLLFSRNEEIYRSVPGDDGSWSRPEVIVSGDVGEPTMTESGDLYFVHVYRSGKNEFDSDIMVARKKR